MFANKSAPWVDILLLRLFNVHKQITKPYLTGQMRILELELRRLLAWFRP